MVGAAGETAADTVGAILMKEPADLPTVERHIPPALERSVDRCLKKSAAARFQSTRDLAFTLEDLSADSDAGVSRAIVGRTPYLNNARLGKEIGKVADPDSTYGPSLSPDGRRVATSRSVKGNTDVWLLEFGRGILSRFTFDTAVDSYPIWSPDGSRIVFQPRP